MPRYIAFLRGINLGQRRLPMSRLQALFESAGFADVATFIASGNVLFSSGVRDPHRLERQIQTHLAAGLGYEVDTFVRTAEQVRAIGAAKVFPEDGEPGITVHVGFFQEPLAAELARKFAAIRTAGDEIRVQGTEYFWLCRGRTSDSILWKLPEIRALGLPTSSMRNMTSLRKLIAQHLG